MNKVCVPALEDRARERVLRPGRYRDRGSVR